MRGRDARSFRNHYMPTHLKQWQRFQKRISLTGPKYCIELVPFAPFQMKRLFDMVIRPSKIAVTSLTDYCTFCVLTALILNQLSSLHTVKFPPCSSSISIHRVDKVLCRGHGYALLSPMLEVDEGYGSQRETWVQGGWNTTQHRMQGRETER